MVSANPNQYGRCDECGFALEVLSHVCEGVIVQLICYQCNNTSFKCIICRVDGTSRQFKTSHLTSNIHLDYVRQNNNSLNDNYFPDNQDESDENTTAPTSTKEYLDALINASDPPTSGNINDSYPHHPQYYAASLDSKAGNYLVNLGQTHQKEGYKSIPDPDTLFALLLSYLTSKLSKNDRSMLVSLLKYVQAHPDTSFVPSNDAHLRRVLIDGTYSIYDNLPVPPIVILENGDVAYVPLKNTIIQQFAKKSRVPNAFLPFIESKHGCSPRGAELLNGITSDMSTAFIDKVYPLKLILWTDAFQCFNVSINSQASAHTCTATVGALDGDHSGAFSFPVWLGKKSGNRDEVERLLVEEIKDLSNQPFPVYHSGINRIVNVSIHLYTFLCDRPDKSGLLSTLTSKFCARFGYAGDLTKIIDSVVCCDECLRFLSLNPSLPIPFCFNCYAFDFKRIQYLPVKNFPPDAIPTGGLLYMKRLKFSDMAKAVQRCFDEISHNRWSNEQAELFMRSEGIAGKLVKNCIKNGQCAYAFQKSKPPLEQAHYDADKLQHPADYDPPVTPPMWQLTDHLDVGVFIDAYMHLLFLGVMKAISTDMIMKFLLPKKKVASFVRTLNKKIGYVHSINAPYMPIHKSCGETKITFGGCLSRQWITICRLSKWLFGHVGSVKSSNVDMDFTTVLPTHNNFFRYKIPEIKFFCYKHGIPIPGHLPNTPRMNCWFGTKMSTPESSFSHFDDDDIINYIKDNGPEALQSVGPPCDNVTRRRAFMEYINAHNVFPPIVTFPIEHVEAEDDLMTNVIVMYQCFVARVMGTDDHQSIDRHCKAFLTNVHKLDTTLKNPHSDPMLLTRFNLLTLLNASDAVRRFGSARSLWEGGAMGEGGIPRLKQRIHDMKKDFSKNALRSFFSKEAMIDMIDQAIWNVRESSKKKSSKINLETDTSLASLITSASTIATDGGDSPPAATLEQTERALDMEDNLIGLYPIEDKFQSCDVIEIVANTRDNNIYILVDKKVRTFRQISVLPNAHEECGCHYFSMEVSTALIDNSALNKKDLVCGFLCHHNTFPSYFYAVLMNWTELTEYGSLGNKKQAFIIPRATQFEYNNSL